MRNERERAIEREQWPLDPDKRQRLQTVAAHAWAVKQDDRTCDVCVPGAELDVRFDDHDPGVVGLEPDGAIHCRVDGHHRVAKDQEREFPRLDDGAAAHFHLNTGVPLPAETESGGTGEGDRTLDGDGLVVDVVEHSPDLKSNLSAYSCRDGDLRRPWIADTDKRGFPKFRI